MTSADRAAHSPPALQAVSFETDAYAIIDTFRWIEPKIFTLVIGEAFGNAALIVAAGEKGARVISPNARMMTCPPRMNRSYGTTKSMMIRANDLDSNMQVSRLQSCLEVEWVHELVSDQHFCSQAQLQTGGTTNCVRCVRNG